MGLGEAEGRVFGCEEILVGGLEGDTKAMRMVWEAPELFHGLRFPPAPPRATLPAVLVCRTAGASPGSPPATSRA